MGDGRKVWVLCRRIAGTKLGPERRKWLAVSADPPEMDAWLAHMAQLGKDAGMEATPLFKGSRTDPKFIEERVRGLSHHQGARRVQQVRLQEVPRPLELTTAEIAALAPIPPRYAGSEEVDRTRVTPALRAKALDDYKALSSKLRTARARSSVPPWSSPREVGSAYS